MVTVNDLGPAGGPAGGARGRGGRGPAGKGAVTRPGAGHRPEKPLRLRLELVAHRTCRRGDANFHQHVPVFDFQTGYETERHDVAPQIGVDNLRQRSQHLILGNHDRASIYAETGVAASGAEP